MPIRTIEEARAFRAKIEGAALHLPEEKALESVELFPKWEPTKNYEVGAKVRQTIKELGGTMPEDLPTPEKSIKQIEREQEKKKLAEKN
jgi:hypothetical protein